MSTAKIQNFDEAFDEIESRYMNARLQNNTYKPG